MIQIFQILAKTVTIIGYSLFSTYISMYSVTVDTVVYFVTILLQTDVMSMPYMFLVLVSFSRCTGS